VDKVCWEWIPSSIEKSGVFLLSLYQQGPIICSVLMLMLFTYPFYAKYLNYLTARANLPSCKELAEQISPTAAAETSQQASACGEER